MAVRKPCRRHVSAIGQGHANAALGNLKPRMIARIWRPAGQARCVEARDARSLWCRISGGSCKVARY